MAKGKALHNVGIGNIINFHPIYSSLWNEGSVIWSCEIHVQLLPTSNLVVNNTVGS